MANLIVENIFSQFQEYLTNDQTLRDVCSNCILVNICQEA